MRLRLLRPLFGTDETRDFCLGKLDSCTLFPWNPYWNIKLTCSEVIRFVCEMCARNTNELCYIILQFIDGKASLRSGLQHLLTSFNFFFLQLKPSWKARLLLNSKNLLVLKNVHASLRSGLRPSTLAFYINVA